MEALPLGEGTNSFSLATQTYTVAAAAAERFWTGRATPAEFSTESRWDAQGRLASHVCLMNTLGINAAPVDVTPCLQALLGASPPHNATMVASK